jgi:DNA repair protein RadA/Sms
VRIDDPACDLAVAAALASAASGIPPPPNSAFVGEIGLTGLVRTAPAMGQRLAAAKASGVTMVFGSAEARSADGVRIAPVRHVADALRWARVAAPSARRNHVA